MQRSGATHRAREHDHPRPLTDISNAWDLEAFEKTAKANYALGRGGQPEEIVGAALYLAGPASSFTTAAVSC